MNDSSNQSGGAELGRRRFLQLSGVGSLLGLVTSPAVAQEATPRAGSETLPRSATLEPSGAIDPEIAELIQHPDQLGSCLTSSEAHGINYHGKVQPWKLAADQVKAAGLDRDSYRLEIALDEDDTPGAVLEQPRTIAAGTALTHSDLVRLMEQKPVRFLKTMTCTNFAAPYGHALWEGVAVRDVLWLAKPKGSIRRVTFLAFDPRERSKVQWHSSRSTARIFEDPPGLAPAFLALKFNGEWLPLVNGGPVRLIVPECYGTTNVKFLRKILLSNDYQNPDSETDWGNDVQTPVKTCAMRLTNLTRNQNVPRGKPLVLAGVAQVGESGLRGVQIAVVPTVAATPAPPPAAGAAKAPPIPASQLGLIAPPADDPHLNKLPWKDAQILPPPVDFAAQLPGGAAGVHGLDPASGQPIEWPIPFFFCNFAAVVRDLSPGHYLAYFRSIDRAGYAQPQPRPLGRKTGVNDQIFHPVPFEVT